MRLPMALFLLGMTHTLLHPSASSGLPKTLLDQRRDFRAHNQRSHGLWGTEGDVGRFLGPTGGTVAPAGTNQQKGSDAIPTFGQQGSTIRHKRQKRYILEPSECDQTLLACLPGPILAASDKQWILVGVTRRRRCLHPVLHGRP